MTKGKLVGEGVTRERLRALPQCPGVYLMKDSGGKVLYVGKAKNLRSRVSSYYGRGDGRHQVEYLIERVKSVDTVVCQDERQALVLESDLIKKYKPHYNVRLKDDKAHLIVRIDMESDWPRLELVRSVYDDGARYLGPFAFSYELRALLEVIKKSVPLRTCSDSVLKNRVRPCLEYQIRRCSGPCCLDVDRKEYALWVEQAVSLLEGKTEEVISELRAELERASEELRYEDAALIRDRMQILGRIKEEKQRVLFGEGSVDALGMYREGEHAELSVLSVRQGRLFGSRTFGFSELSIPNEEFLGSLLSQLYAGEQVLPETVILPFELEDGEIREGMLSEKRGAKVELRVPQRGSKARLLLLAQRNAKENFEARFSAVDKNDRVLAALRTELKLSEMPRVIDCVDISHLQGSSSVAAVVSMRDLKFEKKRYRSFYVSQEGKPDDFASIREVVSRHLSRTAEEGQAPDLMLIDGGPQQLAQAVRAREELGLLAPPFVGIAKKRLRAAPIFARYDGPALMLGKKPERLYLEGREGPVILSPQSEALQALERLRNEAHRSAITFHRKARSKKSFRSVLDDIPGIGPKRRTTILREFGSVEALKLTPPEKMAARAGIPLSLAKRISDLLKKKAG